MKQPTIYGYARISTKKQSLDRQLANIKARYPEAVICSETFTGTKMERPVWTRLYKKLQPGDTVIFDEVSRMSRDAAEGFKTYQELYERGINLVFIKEPQINTDTYRQAATDSIPATGNEIADIYIEATNRVLMLLAKRQIEIAFDQAQAEVEHLHQRTSEGVKRAQAEGKQVGRAAGSTVETKKSREMKEKIRKLSKDFDGSLKDTEVMDILKIARNTYYKYKREMQP